MLENCRILIVGVTGKVGRMLAEKLCYTNRVIGVSSFSNPETRRWISQLPVHPICFDVTQDDVRRLPQQVDYVFFEFAFMHGAEENPSRAWQVNVEAPGQLAEYYRNVRGLIVGSTGGIYPVTPDGADEQTLPQPCGIYPLTRYAQEELLRWLARKNNTPMIFLRYFHAYTETKGFVPQLAQQIQNGEPLCFDERFRNVIWQEDLVRYTLESARLCNPDPEVINLCGPEKVSHRKLAEKIGRLLNKPIKLDHTPQKSLSLLGKCDKMIQLFGSPEVGVNEGIRRVVEAIKSGK